MRIVLLFLFIIGNTSCAQTDNGNRRAFRKEASFLKDSRPCEKALESYKNALNISSTQSSTVYFKLAECAYVLEDVQLCDELIRKGIVKGGAQLTELKNHHRFRDFKEEKFFQKIVEDYNFLRKQYFANIENIDVYLEIENLVARDQFVRKIDDYLDGAPDFDVEEALEKFEKAKLENDSVAFNKYQKMLFPEDNQKYADLKRELMIKVDSLNINRLIEITKEHGWQENAWILLWHQRGTYGKDNYVWNHFKPLIDREMDEGKIRRSFWHVFDDFKKRMESQNFTIVKE